MIVFINLQGGNVLTSLAGLLACVVVNVLLDWLTSSTAAGGGSLWLEMAAGAMGLLFAGIMLAVAIKWFTGHHAFSLRQLFTTALAGGYGLGAAAANARGAQQTVQQRQQRWDKVVRAVGHLPTDVVATEEELSALSAHELKERLAQAGGSCEGAVEKGELIAALRSPPAAGSTSESCVICCEAYTPGDVLRVLPCKHRFHIECVDRWLMSSTDYSRDPACPCCNAVLELS